MLRIDLRSAGVGMQLALPVRNPKAATQILLKIGYELEQESITKLLKLGVRSAWVQYPSLDFIDKYVNSEVVEAQSEVIQEVANTFDGACLNHCPVYGAVGGHAYGWVYSGPMGKVLDPGLIGNYHWVSKYIVLT